MPEEPEHPKCPFYGFGLFSSPSGTDGILMNTQGNQCAVVVSSLHPCDMEMSGLKPDWHSCPVNAKCGESILERMKSFRVIPPDYGSPQGLYVGISFESWKQIVLDLD